MQAIQFKTNEITRNFSITAEDQSGKFIDDTSTNDPLCAIERFIMGFRCAMGKSIKVAIIARNDIAIEYGICFDSPMLCKFFLDIGHHKDFYCKNSWRDGIINSDDPVEVIAIILKFIRETLTEYNSESTLDNLIPHSSAFIKIIYILK